MPNQALSTADATCATCGTNHVSVDCPECGLPLEAFEPFEGDRYTTECPSCTRSVHVIGQGDGPVEVQ